MSRAEYDELKDALRRSVALQSHYAKLLNHYDGGKRMVFVDEDAWIARLKVINALPLAGESTPEVRKPESAEEDHQG